MSKPKLHLLMGLPGSGKTTLAKHLQKITGAIRISSDDFRLLLFPEPTFSQEEHDSLYLLLDHNVEHLLENGTDVIYDANLNRHIHREEKYKLAEKYNADVQLWWLKTPAKISRQRRIDNQISTLIPDGETPERMFERIVEVFEKPHENEIYTEIDGTDLAQAKIKHLLE